jgi:hypothetical protein
MAANGARAWRTRMLSMSGWSLLGLGSVWGCGARTDLLGAEDSLGPPDLANGGSGNIGNSSLTAGTTSGVGGSPMQSPGAISHCPSVLGHAEVCEAKFMCPTATFQTVCYHEGSDGLSCRCLNLSNGNSALAVFPYHENPCFTDAPSLCEL